MSAFNYNTYGATNVDDISNLVYTRDDAIPDKLSVRLRANPPPNDVNKDIDTSNVTDSDMHNHRIKNLMN